RSRGPTAARSIHLSASSLASAWPPPSSFLACVAIAPTCSAARRDLYLLRKLGFADFPEPGSLHRVHRKIASFRCRNRIMQPSWEKTMLRILAWACLFPVAALFSQNLAWAQEIRGNAEPVGDSGFLAELLQTIFTFDSQALLHTLGKPQYTIAAFI